MPVVSHSPAPAEDLAMLCLDTRMLMVCGFIPTAWFIPDFKYRTWFIVIYFFTFVLSSLAVEGLVRRIINVWLIIWIPTAHPRQCFLTANPAPQRLRDKFANVRKQGLACRNGGHIRQRTPSAPCCSTAAMKLTLQHHWDAAPVWHDVI